MLMCSLVFPLRGNTNSRGASPRDWSKRRRAMGKAVKFCRVPRYRELEIMEREHAVKINGLYLGDSGTIYFVMDDNIDFNNNL